MTTSPLTTPTTSPGTDRRRRARPLLRTGAALVTILAIYLIGRAIAEPFVIDLSDASTYRHDWGGPHLAGVLAVHCGPALPSLIWLRGIWARRFAGRRAGAR